jgi:hypothetical protein
MLKSMLAAGVAITGAAAAAQAALIPVSAETAPGVFLPSAPTTGRDIIDNAFSTGDGAFYSLGFGGVAVFDFGAILSGSISVLETTFNCALVGDSCVNHPESVQLFVGASYVSGSFDLTGFTSLGEFGNGVGQAGFSVDATGFRYVALIDTSVVGAGSFDGFDIDAVSVAPIPLPAANWLLLSALGGVALLSRPLRRA